MIPTQISKQLDGAAQELTQAEALLRQMRQTVEDIEDARTIERAKRANGNKPRIPWLQVKKILITTHFGPAHFPLRTHNLRD